MDNTTTNLLDLLAALPDWVEVSAPAGRLTRRLQAERNDLITTSVTTWISTQQAVEELPVSGARILRRMAAGWLEQQRAGGRPPVRVQKKGSAENSDWQFCQEDIKRVGSGVGSTPDAPAETETDQSPENPQEPSDEDDVDLGGLEAHL